MTDKYTVNLFQAALKIQVHCKVQHKYHKGYHDCCFADRTNDNLINGCPLSAVRPELWDVSEEQAKLFSEPASDSHAYLNKVAGDIEEQKATPTPNTRYRWIQWGRDSAYNKYYRCSCCNHEIMLDDMCDPELPSSCEHCGAPM